MIIAIDGPAGAGKSTVARAVAARLGFTYLDTGALYRALTWKAMRDGVPLDSPADMRALLDRTDIRLAPTPDGSRTLVDGEDVSEVIRKPDVTREVHHAANAAEVRAGMAPLQRRLGEAGNVVAEGRDMGTVIFPDAERKFYLDAEVGIRAQRRYLELEARGTPQPLDQVTAEIKLRDERDSSRPVAPLRCAPDATRIDSSNMSVEEVVDAIINCIDLPA